MGKESKRKRNNQKKGKEDRRKEEKGDKEVTKAVRDQKSDPIMSMNMSH